jgi:uncharacterized protein YaaR (DUF327 family)
MRIIKNLYFDSGIQSIKPLTAIRENRSSAIARIESFEDKLTNAKSKTDEQEKSLAFQKLIHSLYSLFSKKNIEFKTQLEFNKSISDWEKSMTKSIQDIANKFRGFVSRLLKEENGMININFKNLREFAGLDNTNNSI